MSVEKLWSDKERFLEDLMDMMVPVEGGAVELRDYRNKNKWISSDYTLSDPGRGSDREVITWTETIEPYYAMKYPVTQRLYHFVMNQEEVEPCANNLPITEVSWLDSIVFCNELSIRSHGIEKTPMDRLSKWGSCFLIHGGFTI